MDPDKQILLDKYSLNNVSPVSKGELFFGVDKVPCPFTGNDFWTADLGSNNLRQKCWDTFTFIWFYRLILLKIILSPLLPP